MSSPLQLVRVKFLFSNFSIFPPNYVILRHLAKKKCFKNFFKKPFLAILAMKEASKRCCSFMQSCSASKILVVRWSQILDISKNVDSRGFSQKIAYLYYKSEPPPAKNFSSVQPTAVVKGKIFVFKFFQFSRRIM